MKVKELLEKLKELDPEKEVTYECMYVDYVLDRPTGNVDLGGCHTGMYKNLSCQVLVNKGNPKIKIFAPKIVKERNSIGHPYYKILNTVDTWVTKPQFYALDWTLID